jgi:hypothetical protein
LTTLSSGRRALAARLSAPAADAPPLPDYVTYALARMRLLQGIPFQYLVPNPGLLPEGSVRFFFLDPAWLGQLVAGALAVGGDGAREQAQATAARDALVFGLQLSVVRDVERGRVTLADLPPEALADAPEDAEADALVTGFVLRSSLVSGWPGLQVRAFASDDPQLIPPGADPAELEQAHPELVIPILRLEQLAPSVLLVLFGGVPRLIWLEEPHHGVQFGVDSANGGLEIPLRDEQGEQVGSQTVAVPMRSASLGVVDVAGLAAALDQARPLPQARRSAALALALLQAPSRQRFTAREEEE